MSEPWNANASPFGNYADFFESKLSSCSVFGGSGSVRTTHTLNGKVVWFSTLESGLVLEIVVFFAESRWLVLKGTITMHNPAS